MKKINCQINSQKVGGPGPSWPPRTPTTLNIIEAPSPHEANLAQVNANPIFLIFN